MSQIIFGHDKINYIEILVIINSVEINQSSSWHNMAVPLKVQKSAGKLFVVKSIGKIKFVLCPVVERTPALLDVL